MPVKSFVDKNEVVENKDRKFGSNLEYFPVYVKLRKKDDAGNEIILPALFTAHQIAEAIERAEKNPEDVSERASWLDKIFS